METSVTATPDAKPRGTRLPRLARRRQLLGAAQEVFVAQGLSRSRDGRDRRAGRGQQARAVPALPRQAGALPGAARPARRTTWSRPVRDALASTTDNKQRVQATFSAFFDFVAEQGEAFRLVFESDLRNEPRCARGVERTLRECAEMISQVIQRGHRLHRATRPTCSASGWSAWPRSAPATG